VQNAFGGTLPNLFGVLAGSPAAIKASSALSEIVDGTSLSPLEQQVIEIAVSRENRCDYCLAAQHLPVAPPTAAAYQRPLARGPARRNRSLRRCASSPPSSSRRKGMCPIDTVFTKAISVADLINQGKDWVSGLVWKNSL